MPAYHRLRGLFVLFGSFILLTAVLLWMQVGTVSSQEEGGSAAVGEVSDEISERKAGRPIGEPEPRSEEQVGGG